MLLRNALLSSSLLVLSVFSSIGQVVYEGPKAHQILHGAEVIRFKYQNQAPNYIRFQKQVRPNEDLGALLLRKILKMRPADELRFLKSERDAIGMEHIRFKQFYQSIPVEHGGYKLHIQDGYITSANGEYYPNINVSTVPTISASQAIQRAISFTGALQYMWEIPSEEADLKWATGSLGASYYPQPTLTIVATDGNYKNPQFRLAWKMDVYAVKPLSRNFVFVDAQTGEVIFAQNRIHTADVQGTATTVYSGVRTITTDFTGSTYRLRETGRGNGIQTYDMNEGTSYGAAVDFTDADNNWNNVNAQLDQYATDAHFGAEMTYDYFFTTFNRNSIDGNGFMLRSYIHYDQDYNNAYWDGQRMTYGDGDGSAFRPLTSIDIAAHEITHGLTNFTADLIYQNESGALNEGFSDIFGVIVDFYARGALNWRIGEEATPNGQGIRRMDNPNSFNQPDTYLGTSWYSGTQDNGGVHINSGVHNHWFYRLVVGGAGTNDVGNTFNVTAQGINVAGAVSFRNLTVYMDQNSDYVDARFYAIQSAIDLYGPCTPEVIATTNAWHAVGVGAAFSNTITASFTVPTTSYCQAPATISFSNTSINGGSFTWYFGDGTTSNAINPTHTYQNYGIYTVKLVANGGSCGNDSVVLTDYIVVDQNVPCAVNLSQSGSNATQTTCTGTIFDSGGPSGNYQDNTSSVITIAPSGAATVTLNFTVFEFEDQYDYLFVYDGPSINSPLIGQFTGNNLPNGGTITSSGGAITLRQFTDPGVVAPGFAVNWSCILPTTPPTANFESKSQVSCDGLIEFRDMSTNGPTTWHWDFGDGDTSNLQNPTHNYLVDGIYTVTLTATNAFGADTYVRSAYVQIDRPDAPLGVDQSSCTDASLNLSATASGDVLWYVQALGGSSLFTGSTFTTPLLNSTTTYYVENQVPGQISNVGPATTSIGAGGQHNNTSVQYLTFTVLQPLTLKSVLVNAGGAGNRTITLWDNSGNQLDTRFLSITTGTSRVNLNFDLQPGTYRIGGTQMNLYRNSAGASFPYTIPNLISITGSSAGGGFYYYFYDWEVQEAPCVSPRVPVTAFIGSPVASFTSSTNGLSVNFTANAGTATSWSWNFGDGNTGTGASTSHTYTAPGTYLVTLTVSDGNCSGTFQREVVITNTTAVQDPLNMQMVVYPNPFTSQLTVQLPLISGATQIEVFDMMGKKLATLFEGTATSSLSVQWQVPPTLAQGVYVVRTENQGKVYYKKVVLTR